MSAIDFNAIRRYFEEQLRTHGIEAVEDLLQVMAGSCTQIAGETADQELRADWMLMNAAIDEAYLNARKVHYCHQFKFRRRKSA